MPDSQAAATLGTIIDYGRLALGWNRLPEKEQDAMICSFYLELTDEGVPEERWMDCYRAVAKKRRQMMREGHQVGALAAGELVTEWHALRAMHAELDKSRLLANPGRDCLRCFGADPECPHDPLTPEEEEERRKGWAEEAKKLREDLAKRPAVKAFPAVNVKEDLTVTLTCSEPDCRRRVNSKFGWNYNDVCGERVPGPVREGERLACAGLMKVM